MTAQTILFDFTIGEEFASEDAERQKVVKSVKAELQHVYPQLELAYQMPLENGYYGVFHQNGETIISIRVFQQGLVTVNVEYYLKNGKEQPMSFDIAKQMEDAIARKLGVKTGQVIPPIKRGDFAKYFPSSDERIIEYDIDNLVCETRSQHQKIQIMHSKTLGNMLILDELQNIAESDLIYTETLMCRGKEDYKDKTICILGGGDGALLYELLKENPAYVVMVEIDELVMQICNKYLKSICGDVLQDRKGENYEIIVGDCVAYMDKCIKDKRKFDYVFGDLTDIPISENPTGEIWDFIRIILQKAFQILGPTGKYMTHGNGSCCIESLQRYEQELGKIQPEVKFTQTKAFVPSFMEEWVFYQVSFA